MKYLIAIFLTLIPTTALADVSLYPPFPLPVLTMNCLLAAASSSTLGCTSAPTASGANIMSGTIPNAALVSLPDITTSAVWTPTDQSGASLSLTTTSATYQRVTHGDGSHTLIIQADVTYPSTVNGSAASMSLPFGVNNNCALSLVVSGIATTVSVFGSGGQMYFFHITTGTAASNALMSTGRFIVAGVCSSA